MKKTITKKVLYIPIETLSRELDAKILLALEAMNRGYQVYLGRKRILKKVAEKVGTGIYITKDYVKHKKSDYAVNESTMLFIVLHEEALSFLDIKRDLYLSMPKKVNDYHDFIFQWGTIQHNIFKEQFKEFKNISYVTGHPKFDLFESKFQSKLTNSQMENYILVTTNFADYNPSKLYDISILEQLNEITARANDGSTDKIPDNFEKMYSYQKELINKYIDLVKYLSVNLRSQTIVLKPHPSENVGMWKIKLKDLPNVVILSEGNILKWISGAKFIIHTGSTVGIETVLLGKTPLQFNPIYNPELEPDLPNKVSEKFNSKEELLNYINGSKLRQSDFSSKEILKDYIYNLNKKNASKVILDKIEELSNFQTKSPIYKTPSYPIENLKYNLLNKLSKMVFVKNLSFFKKVKGYFRKYPVISLKEFNLRVDEIYSALNPSQSKFDDIKISDIGASSYFLSNNKFSK